MSDNINEIKEMTEEVTETVTEAVTENAAEKDTSRMTPEYIMEQIEKLLQEREHIGNALDALQSIDYGTMSVPDLAGQARMTAIADVVKCREATVQQALSFYYKMYEQIKPSQLDVAIAQAERILNAPMYSQYHSPETKGCHERELHDVIMGAFKEGLQNQTHKETNLEFKRRAMLEHIQGQSMTPQEIKELFAILDD